MIVQLDSQLPIVSALLSLPRRSAAAAPPRHPSGNVSCHVPSPLSAARVTAAAPARPRGVCRRRPGHPVCLAPNGLAYGDPTRTTGAGGAGLWRGAERKQAANTLQRRGRGVLLLYYAPRAPQDHMLEVDWRAQGGWSSPTISPTHALSLDPASSCLHYGLQASSFSGLYIPISFYRLSFILFYTFSPAPSLRAAPRSPPFAGI